MHGRSPISVCRRHRPCHLHRQQGLEGGLLLRRGREPAADDLAVAEGLADLGLDVLLEAPDHQPLVPEVFRGEVVRVRDGGGVQHVHQAREAARPAVVRGRGEHDEGVGAPGQQAGEAAAQRARAAVRHVVRLVDHDDVPVRLFQVRAVLGVLLQGVDRDDRLVVVVEGVVAGRDPAPHALDADGVEPGQRDGEAVPELLLELREHALDGQHQDPAAPAARDQLAHQDARLQGLAEPHRVGDEDALARLAERLAGGVELVGHQVHRRPVAHVDALVARDGLAKLALHPEPAVREAGGGVGDEPGFGGVQHPEVRLQGGEEDRFALADQLRDPVADEPVSAVRGQVGPPHDPLRIPDQDAGAGGGDGVGGGGHGGEGAESGVSGTSS